MKRKKIIYAVDPRYFYDSKGNGIGSISGITKKIDYFKWLNINVIVLKNCLNYSFEEIDLDMGTSVELKELINAAKKASIDIYLEWSFGGIKENHIWYKDTNDIFLDHTNFYREVDYIKNIELKLLEDKSSKAKGFYFLHEKTGEIRLNWKSLELMKKMIKIAISWYQFGIKGFVIKNFEYLNDISFKNPLNSLTKKSLVSFFTYLKSQHPDISILGYSHYVTYSYLKDIIKPNNMCFDQIILDDIATLGIKKIDNISFIDTFYVKNLFKILKQYENDNKIVFSINSELYGKVCSRWFQTNAYQEEINKSLLTLLFFSGRSFLINMGEEIGITNFQFNESNQINTSLMQIQQRRIQAKGISSFKFWESQFLLHYFANQQTFPWSLKTNGGFSSATLKPNLFIPNNLRILNLAYQFNNPHSVVNYFQYLIKLIQNPTFLAEITPQNLVIKNILKDVLLLKYKSKQMEVNVFINLSNKIKRIYWYNFWGKYVCLKTNYPTLKQTKELNYLSPYETMIFMRFINQKKHNTPSYEQVLGDLMEQATIIK
ncbi:MAG: hypothetical protein E7Y34_00375 [Mycoplasma sp.]|nr:hypothetical protein [Mycoplasma sp.]